MDNKKILLGFLGGMAIGAIAGLLLAPEKGSETRKALQKFASDVADAVEDSLHNAIDGVKENYADVMHKGEDLVEKVAEKIGSDLSGKTT